MDNIIFLDTESTGNDTTKDRLCQVCYKKGDVIETEFFKPPLPISIKAMSITHITNEMVDDKEPFKVSAYYDELKEVLKTHVLIAHNAAFDVALLKAERLEVPQYICTMKLAQHLDENGEIPEYNQQFLRYYYNLRFDRPINPHDAESDVIVLESIYNELKKKFIKKYGEKDMLKKMIEISTLPTLIKSFAFGKYRGESVDNIAIRDKGYLEWLLTQKKLKPEGEQDWIYTLEYYLKGKR